MGKDCVLAVIIVVFGRHERLRKHLSLLSAESRRPDMVVLVNTGTEDVAWARADYGKAFRVETMRLGNVGPSGGFREGAKLALGLGCDYVIFADDDAHPQPGALARLMAHADNEVGAAAGHYLSGDPVITSNHYLMVKRDVLARTGLYFAPFFIMMEDSEFYDRVDAEAHILHDSQAVIDHPCRPVQPFERWRLTTRNLLICASLPKGKGAGFVPFLRACITMPLRTSFLSAFTWNAGFVRACMHGFLDYSLGKSGRPDKPLGGTFEPKAIAALEPSSIDAAVVRTDAERNMFGGKGVEEWALRKSLSPFGMLACALRWAGKIVYMSGSFFFADMSAYLPCALLAKEVFTEDFGRPAHAFRGGLLKAAAFIATFLPLAALCASLSLPLYFIRGRTYRGMFEKQMGEDAQSCR